MSAEQQSERTLEVKVVAVLALVEHTESGGLSAGAHLKFASLNLRATMGSK